MDIDYLLLLQQFREATGGVLNSFMSYITTYGEGLYGLMMLAWFDGVILLTEGAGFDGATFGVSLAAMTFACTGQHPRNVWPILAGYACLSLLVTSWCAFSGRELPWTLSSQGYMNGLAFATGLCPFSGVCGWPIGLAAGFISAVICTTTSAMHGGFVLYNGGLTAGITALVLLPLLEMYKKDKGKPFSTDPQKLPNPDQSIVVQ